MLRAFRHNNDMTQKIHPESPRASAQSGFTLVEMAIALVVIGLLLAGILKGEEIYRQAQVRRVMQDINSVSAATKGFQERYGAVPGDFALATRRVPNCNDAYHCTNGNSDGLVGRYYGGASSGWDRDQSGITSLPEVETTLFWKHLALSKFLKGIDPSSDPARPEWSRTHPVAATGGGFHVFADTRNAGSSLSIRLSKDVTYTNKNQAIDPALRRPFTVKQAKYMDEKYDDGKAAAGNMWGIPYAGAGGNPPCRRSWSGSGGEQYNLSPADNAADTFTCQFHFVFH